MTARILCIADRVRSYAIYVGVLLIGLQPGITFGQMYWDINGADPGAGGATPSGTWDAATANWNFNFDGSIGTTTWVDGSAAVFSAGGDATGTFDVTLVDTRTVNGLTFEEGDVTISGGTELTLGDPSIDVVSGAAGTINTALGGFNGLTKTGDGVLTLGGANAAFSGTITVSTGTLKVTNSGVFGVIGTGTTDAVTVSNGATLEIVDGVSITDRTFLSGTGVGGLGGIRKTGAGDSTILGGITFGSAGGSVIADEGTLTIQQNPNGAIFASGEVTMGGAGNINTTASPNTNIAIGVHRLVKVGTGTLTLGGNSSRTGGTTILGGMVSFSTDFATGSQDMGVAPSVFTPDHIILNGGGLQNTNPGNAGNFLVENRGIQIGPDGGTVDYTSSDTGTVSIYSGLIGVTPGTVEATLYKTGPHEFRYNGSVNNDRSNTGFTQLVVNEGLFRLGSVTGGVNTELGFGALPVAPKADAIVLDGGAIGTSFNVTLDVNRGITLGSNGGFFNTSASAMTIPGIITGVGSLNKDTGGTLNLNGANDYSGGTMANAGTIVLGDAAATLGTGDVTVGGILRLQSSVLDGIADTATLSLLGGGDPGIADAGYLELGAGLNEIVGGLVLGGLVQSAGTYGSSTSGATNIFDEFFAGSGILTVGGGTLPGDLNGDGLVNAADYVFWRDQMSDDITGYNNWRNDFGGSAGSGSAVNAAVPEPSSLVILISAVVGLVFLRRRTS